MDSTRATADAPGSASVSVIAGGQQLEDAGGAAAAVLAGAMPSQCLAADHSQLRRGRLGPAALAGAVRRRPGGHGRHRPGPLGQRAGPGVQVQHGHRLVPDPGQDLAGHQRGHRLAGADGAAEHHDPARAGHLQQGPGPVPLREVRLTRPVTARHDHNPVAPAVPAPVRGPAQRTLDHPQWPVAAPVPRHRHRRPGRRRLSRLLRGRRLGRRGPAVSAAVSADEVSAAAPGSAAGATVTSSARSLATAGPVGAAARAAAARPVAAACPASGVCAAGRGSAGSASAGWGPDGGAAGASGRAEAASRNGSGGPKSDSPC